jgi:hypothetical protein
MTDPRETLRLILLTVFEAALGADFGDVPEEEIAEQLVERLGRAGGLSETEIIERLGRKYGLSPDEVRVGFAAMEDNVSWNENGNPLGPPLQ